MTPAVSDSEGLGERAKMLSGDWYDPSQLTAHRLKAQDACARFNALMPSDTEARKEILHGLLGRMGTDCLIEAPFRCDYGWNIRMGDRCVLNYNCTLLDCAPITFGSHVLCGPNCSFYTPIHPMDSAHRLTDEERAEPIVLEDNVWLGGGVTVLPGVRIGRNTVVGAGSVVTKSLPADCFAAGNPARVMRFAERRASEQ